MPAPEKTTFVSPSVIITAIHAGDLNPASAAANRYKAQMLARLHDQGYNDGAENVDDGVMAWMKMITGKGQNDVVTAALVASFRHSISEDRSAEVRSTAQRLYRTVRDSGTPAADRICALVASFRDGIDATTYDDGQVGDAKGGQVADAIKKTGGGGTRRVPAEVTS